MVELSEDDNTFRIVIEGPPDSPYDEGIFYLSGIQPVDYPFKPPKIRFITPVYHPEVNERGMFSLRMLHDRWSPAYMLPHFIQEILAMLRCPNPDDPLVPEIARQ